MVRDVGDLIEGARASGSACRTFAVDGNIRFASAADRADFAEELGAAVATLVAKYHDDEAPRGT